MDTELKQMMIASGLEEKASTPFFHRKGKKDKNDNRREGMIVIAAVNLGTRYSSFAYTFRDELDKVREPSVPCSVIYKQWTSGSDAGFFSNKTPTCLLLNPAGNFDSFGYPAEEKYCALMNDNVHNGWKFFKHFKTILLNEKVDRIILIYYYK